MTVRADNHGIRALSASLEHGHGGMDAVLAGFIAACGDNAPVRFTAHQHALAPQSGIIQLLDGREKCIHIHVQDHIG